jgi:hypothetical protein
VRSFAGLPENRSRSVDEEEWTVVGPKSQPRLLLKRRLDEGKRTSKGERMESEKKMLAEVLLTSLQNNLFQMPTKRAQYIKETLAACCMVCQPHS